MLTINNISQSIDKKLILDDVSIEVQKGECVALLGPNGSGKSTLIDIITGAIKPDCGNVRLFSNPFQKVKHKIGVLYEHVPLFYNSKVKEIIAYVSSVYRVKRSDIIDIIKLLEIDKIEDKLVKVLSKGERKKVGILLTTLHNPALVILDEPTSDLDPIARDTVWKYLLQKNRTVFFTTHLWEEAEKIADHVIFILNGRIIAKDTPESFMSKIFINKKVKVSIPYYNGCESLLKDLLFVKNNNDILIYPENIESFLSENEIPNFTISNINLKDVYLHLTKKKHAICDLQN